jgi:hypothetical protein
MADHLRAELPLAALAIAVIGGFSDGRCDTAA